MSSSSVYPPDHGRLPADPTQKREFPKNNIPLPTVGRIVYWFANRSSLPRAAIVADVVGGHEVMLGVFFADGNSSGTGPVKHVDDVDSPYGPYWDWMPYQKGQAAKTEELQKELDAKITTNEQRQLIETRREENRQYDHVPKIEPRLKSTDEYNQSVDEAFKNQSSTPSPEDGKR